QRAPLFLAASTLVTYGAGLAAERRTPAGRWAGWAAILAHVLLVAAWKWAPIGMQQADPAMNADAYIIPLGLSFYAFQSIAYVADVMKGKQRAEKDIVRFALFQAFLPKLAAGPIERGTGLLQQLQTVQPITRTDVNEGIFLIVWGLVKKFTIAGGAALIADPAFANPWGLGPYNILAVMAFALQLYADFSGYSDIARGASRLLGFRLQMNFLRPFAAASPDDFWRRWHITLSQWVRDYVYIPLGGNRKGELRAALNVLLAMLIIGFWHGMACTFVLWGLFQGVLTLAYRAGKGLFAMPKPLAVCGFFALNLIGWALFRSQNLELFGMMMQSALSPADSPAPVPYALVLLVALAAPLAAVEWWQSRHGDDEAPSRSAWYVLAAFYLFAFYALLLGAPAHAAPFIYANF
ncbi:MAG TPA: MBOAT family O-acyltransferase, partial [Candidatus Peribacteria bacterium]|nr:MBOAT family O-acyltransferase [Candidatus Peribacteria bacterium]